MNAWEMEAAPLFVASVKTSSVGLELVRPSEACEGRKRAWTNAPFDTNTTLRISVYPVALNFWRKKKESSIRGLNPLILLVLLLS